MSFHASNTPGKSELSLIEAARELVPLVKQHADQTDADRELPKPLFHALADADNQKFVVVPMETSGLLGSIAGIAELTRGALPKPEAPPPRAPGATSGVVPPFSR